MGYSLKFIKLSKYVSSLVYNARDEMSSYIIGVSEEIEEECNAAMFHDHMDLSRLTVNAQQVNDSRLRKSNREDKKARSFKPVSFKFVKYSQL